MTEPPPIPPDPPVLIAELPTVPTDQLRADGTLVIDLTRLVPPPPEDDCGDAVPDPFNPEIVVCDAAAVPSQRLGPQVGPVDDGFGGAIPRARIKLSDKAAAEANATAPSVGGWNAQGGEVRVKIDF